MNLPDPDERMAFALDLQSGIGSSDAPDLVGVGFNGPGKVWYSKFCDPHEIANVPLDGRLRRGLMLEPMVAAEYTNLTDVELVKADRIRHPERNWQRASPDRRRVNDNKMVELKAIDFFDDTWGPMLSDRLPDKYTIQSTHQMGVAGELSMFLCATAVLTWETRIYALGFDENLFDWITAVEEDFYKKYILTKTPPPVGWEDKHKMGYKDRTTDPSRPYLLFDTSIGDLCERRALLKGLVKEADAEIDEIGEKLLDAMGPHGIAVSGDWLLNKRHTKGSDKRRESYRVDAKKQKETE